MEDLRQSGYIIAPDLPPPPTHPPTQKKKSEVERKMGGWGTEREREITTETGAEESSVQEFDLREC